MADSVLVAQPIRLQYTSRILFKFDRNTELARAVDVIMARAKRIYILIIKVSKLFSFYRRGVFLKETRNMFFMFLSSFR